MGEAKRRTLADGTRVWTKRTFVDGKTMSGMSVAAELGRAGKRLFPRMKPGASLCDVSCPTCGLTISAVEMEPGAIRFDYPTTASPCVNAAILGSDPEALHCGRFRPEYERQLNAFVGGLSRRNRNRSE